VTPPTRCPCGSGEVYLECCGRFHAGDAIAPTALALMRSRFAAFAFGDAAYLLRTWHPTTRPPALEFDGDRKWTRLEIVYVVAGSPFDSSGVVEFRAHYRSAGVARSQHERSMFVREDGQWFYLRPS
jgi:SEC-C motif domain protein